MSWGATSVAMSKLDKQHFVDGDARDVDAPRPVRVIAGALVCVGYVQQLDDDQLVIATKGGTRRLAVARVKSVTPIQGEAK